MPRDVNAIVEPWTPPGEGERDIVAGERRWARESVRYLRTLIADRRSHAEVARPDVILVGIARLRFPDDGTPVRRGSNRR